MKVGEGKRGRSRWDGEGGDESKSVDAWLLPFSGSCYRVPR